MRYIPGINAVNEVLGRKDISIEVVYIAKERKNAGKIKEIVRKCNAAGVGFKFVPIGNISRMSSSHHQGVLAVVALVNYHNWRESIESNQKIVLYLDRVSDCGNFGAILRSASCFGVEWVLTSRRESAPVNEFVAKSSAGAISHLKIARVDSALKMVREFKNSGYQVISAEASGRPLNTSKYSGSKVLLIMGGEDKGVRKSILEECDDIVSIPMKGKLNSLNVSVASGIMLYEFSKLLLLLLFFITFLMPAFSNSNDDANNWYIQAKYNYFERFDYFNAYKCLKKSLQIDNSFKPAIELKAKMGKLYDFFIKLDKPLPKPIIKLVKPTKEVEIIDIPKKKNEIAGTEEFEYKLALKKLKEHEFEDARKLLLSHLNKFPENINAYYYLFLIAMHEKDIKEMDRIMDICSSILSNYKDTDAYRRFVEMIICYRNKLIINSAFSAYNADNSLKNTAIGEYRFSYLDRKSEKPVYPIMKKLDLSVLMKSGFLKTIPKCPSGGDYSIDNGEIICSIHDRFYEKTEEKIRDERENISLADKNNAYFHIRLSRKFIREKRYYRALAEAKSALKYNKYDYRAYDALSQSYYYLGKIDKALENALKSKDMAIDEPMVYNNLGIIYMAMNKNDDAIKELRHGLAIRTSDYDLNYNIGIAYSNKDELKKAMHYFEVARIVNPNSPGVYFQLGRIYQKLNMKEQAIKTYKKLLHLVPGQGKLYNMIESMIENIKR